MPTTDKQTIASLLDRYRKAPSQSSADRIAKDQLLDELQDAVGLAGQMSTEQDILRRAHALLQAQ